VKQEKKGKGRAAIDLRSSEAPLNEEGFHVIHSLWVKGLASALYTREFRGFPFRRPWAPKVGIHTLSLEVDRIDTTGSVITNGYER